MSNKLDQALAAGYFALAQALPDSDRSDTGSAASSESTTTARREGLPDGGKNRIGLANVVAGVTLTRPAAVVLARPAAVTSTRPAAVMPRLARRPGAPRRCFGWPAS